MSTGRQEEAAAHGARWTAFARSRPRTGKGRAGYRPVRGLKTSLPAPVLFLVREEGQRLVHPGGRKEGERR